MCGSFKYITCSLLFKAQSTLWESENFFLVCKLTHIKNTHLKLHSNMTVVTDIYKKEITTKLMDAPWWCIVDPQMCVFPFHSRDWTWQISLRSVCMCAQSSRIKEEALGHLVHLRSSCFYVQKAQFTVGIVKAFRLRNIRLIHCLI